MDRKKSFFALWVRVFSTPPQTEFFKAWNVLDNFLWEGCGDERDEGKGREREESQRDVPGQGGPGEVCSLCRLIFCLTFDLGSKESRALTLDNVLNR